MAELSKALSWLSCRGLGGVGSNPAGDIYSHFEFFAPSLFRTGQRSRCKWNQACPFIWSHSCLDPRYDLSYKTLYISTCSVALRNQQLNDTIIYISILIHCPGIFVYKTNHPISSNGHPSATAYKVMHCLKWEGGGYNTNGNIMKASKANIYFFDKRNDHNRQAKDLWRILILMWHISTRLTRM